MNLTVSLVPPFGLRLSSSVNFSLFSEIGLMTRFDNVIGQCREDIMISDRSLVSRCQGKVSTPLLTQKLPLQLGSNSIGADDTAIRPLTVARLNDEPPA
jgi:hypothetical protein